MVPSGATVKITSDTSGNRSRDLPTTTLPQAPKQHTIWQLTNEQSDSSQFTVSLHTEENNWHSLRPLIEHESCVTPTVSSQILCHTHSLITNPASHPQSHHKSCVTPTVSSQILCHTHSHITNPVSLPQSHHKSCVTPTVTSQILCHTQSHYKSCVTPSHITNPASHPQSHHKSCVTPTVSSQTH